MPPLAPSPQRPTPPATVLAIDDDPAMRAVLAAALTDAGYRVLTATNWEAQGVAHELQPDVILLDLLMPGLDGATLSRHLRALEATAAIPLVALSARADLAAVAPTLPLDAWLPKPFDLDQLDATLAACVRGQPGAAGRDAPGRGPAEAS